VRQLNNPPQRGAYPSRTTLRRWIREKVNSRIDKLRDRIKDLEGEVKQLKKTLKGRK
jgi:hypothetical protein